MWSSDGRPTVAVSTGMIVNARRRCTAPVYERGRAPANRRSLTVRAPLAISMVCRCYGESLLQSADDTLLRVETDDAIANDAFGVGVARCLRCPLE